MTWTETLQNRTKSLFEENVTGTELVPPIAQVPDVDSNTVTNPTFRYI